MYIDYHYYANNISAILLWLIVSKFIYFIRSKISICSTRLHNLNMAISFRYVRFENVYILDKCKINAKFTSS